MSGIASWLAALREHISVPVAFSILSLVVAILSFVIAALGYRLHARTFRVTNRPYVGIVHISNAFVHNPPHTPGVVFPEGKALINPQTLQQMDTFFVYKNAGRISAEDVHVELSVKASVPGVQAQVMPSARVTLMPDQTAHTMMRFTGDQVRAALRDPDNLRVQVRITYKDPLGTSYGPRDWYWHLYVVPVQAPYHDPTWPQIPAFR